MYLEQRLEDLEVVVKNLQSKIALLEGTKVEKEVNNDSQLIYFEGMYYYKVNRLAQEGDIVIPQVSGGDVVVAGKVYKVNDNLEISSDKGFVSVYNTFVGRTEDKVDVYTLAEFKCEKSINDQRKEIIYKAKELLKNTKTTMTGIALHGKNAGEVGVWKDVYKTPIKNEIRACKVEFVVNTEKKTVVAIMRGVDSNNIHAKGIAKCLPSDVFNVHIGKAIALGRALNIDVSEFTDAIQPDKLEVGQLVKSKINKEHTWKITELKNDSVECVITNSERTYCVGSKCSAKNSGDWEIIIDDSNAKY